MITDEQRRQGGSLPTAQDIQNYRDSLSGSSGGGQYNGWASWAQMTANPGKTPADVAAQSPVARPTTTLQGVLEASYGDVPTSQLDKYYDFSTADSQGYADVFQDAQLLSSLGGSSTDAGQLAAVREAQDLGNYDADRLEVKDDKVYLRDSKWTDPLSAALGTFANFGLSLGTGNLFGIGATLAGANPQTAGLGATLSSVATRALSPFNMDSYVDPLTGEEYVDLSLFGINTFRPKEEQQRINEEAFAKAELERANQGEDDYDATQSLATGFGMAEGGSTGGGSSWRDFWNKPTLTFDDFARDIITGGDLSPEAVDAAQFAMSLEQGQDPVQAALQVYGDNITSVLPEGYQRPTEAGLRIAAGENRVSVLGDVYGEDLNLDNPLGKASVDGLATYDQTGDSDAALQDFVFTYVKEGGLQGDVELPNIFEGAENLIQTPDWLKNSGLSDLEILEYLPRINGAQFNDFTRDVLRTVDPTQLKKYIPKIDLSGASLKDLGVTYDELTDLGFDMSDLPELGQIDLPDIDFPDLPSFDLNFVNRSVAGLGAGPQVDFSTDVYTDIEGSEDDIARALLENLDNRFLS